MILLELELIRRLRYRFWMPKSMHTDTAVLSITEGRLARTAIEFGMKMECLRARITGRRSPWMEK